LSLARDDKVIRDPRKIRVPQAGQDPGFPLELSGVIFGSEKVFFDGYNYVEILVPGQVHRAHASLAKDAFNVVPIVKGLSGF
jgi:hypothetical protein